MVKLGGPRRIGPRSVALAAVLLLVLALAAVFAVGAWWNSSPTVRHAGLYYPDLPAGLDGFTILLLSDLHSRRFGAGQQELLQLLEEERWDAAVLAGDYLANFGDSSAAALRPTVEVAEYLAGRSPCYYVLGNYEGFGTYGYFTKPGGTTVAALEDAGALPVYPAQRLDFGGGHLWLSDWSRRPPGADDTAWVPSGVFPTDLDEKRDFIVAVTHRSLDLENPDRVFPEPDLVLPDAEWRAAGQISWDLNLSGHTHGGQWRLPRIGPLFGNVERGRLPFGLLPRHGDRYTWGVTRLAAATGAETAAGGAAPGVRYQVITSGLGGSGPLPLRVRLFCRPEVVLITLHAGTAE